MNLDPALSRRTLLKWLLGSTAVLGASSTVYSFPTILRPLNSGLTLTLEFFEVGQLQVVTGHKMAREVLSLERYASQFDHFIEQFAQAIAREEDRQMLKIIGAT